LGVCNLTNGNKNLDPGIYGQPNVGRRVKSDFMPAGTSIVFIGDFSYGSWTAVLELQNG